MKKSIYFLIVLICVNFHTIPYCLAENKQDDISNNLELIKLKDEMVNVEKIIENLKSELELLKMQNMNTMDKKEQDKNKESIAKIEYQLQENMSVTS